jgi:hypothetical protein
MTVGLRLANCACWSSAPGSVSWMVVEAVLGRFVAGIAQEVIGSVIAGRIDRSRPVSADDIRRILQEHRFLSGTDLAVVGSQDVLALNRMAEAIEANTAALNRLADVVELHLHLAIEEVQLGRDIRALLLELIEPSRPALPPTRAAMPRAISVHSKQTMPEQKVGSRALPPSAWPTAGWYFDPLGFSDHRRWTGREWSHEVRSLQCTPPRIYRSGYVPSSTSRPPEKRLSFSPQR